MRSLVFSLLSYHRRHAAAHSENLATLCRKALGTYARLIYQTRARAIRAITLTLSRVPW